MATSAVIPVNEYLATTYRPDCDYVEGDLEERNMGEQTHARVQLILGKIFDNHRKAWGTRTATELRVQVRSERFRVPDICVLRRSDPFEQIVTRAPLLCVEVLSGDDSLNKMQERVNDYIAMGVENVWVVDPWSRIAYYASERGFLRAEDGTLRIEGTAVAVTLAEVFAELDEA